MTPLIKGSVYAPISGKPKTLSEKLSRVTFNLEEHDLEFLSEEKDSDVELNRNAKFRHNRLSSSKDLEFSRKLTKKDGD